MNEADAESNVRGFLQQCLSPESLAFMDGLIRRIEAEVDNPKPVDEGESSTQQDLLLSFESGWKTISTPRK
jgi:hypothetical protein